MCRSPDGELTELEANLAFANGVALDREAASVFIAGQTQVFLDSLPGFPNDLTFAESILWVGYASLRNPHVDMTAA